MDWSPGGRRRGGFEVKWENEVERLMKQMNLTCDEATTLEKRDCDPVTVVIVENWMYGWIGR